RAIRAERTAARTTRSYKENGPPVGRAVVRAKSRSSGRGEERHRAGLLGGKRAALAVVRIDAAAARASHGERDGAVLRLVTGERVDLARDHVVGAGVAADRAGLRLDAIAEDAVGHRIGAARVAPGDRD